MRALAIAFVAGALLAAPVADAAVSRFKFDRAAERDAIERYEHIVVDAFDDAVKRRKKNAQAEASFRDDIAAVSDRIADRIVERLRASGRYEGVERGREGAGALLIDGRLTTFKRANVATRYLGLGAGSKLEGVVTISDAETGQPFGTIKLDFSSSGIPGFTNLVQTVDAFIEGIAVRVADEVMIAQGKLHREQTGRSARLREKYGRD